MYSVPFSFSLYLTSTHALSYIVQTRQSSLYYNTPDHGKCLAGPLVGKDGTVIWSYSCAIGSSYCYCVGIATKALFRKIPHTPRLIWNHVDVDERIVMEEQNKAKRDDKVIPGSFLGPVSEFTCGKGTYTRHKYIYAAITGKVN